MAEKKNDIDTKATFDKETDVNLSIEQLSYICKYCGKVNSISAPNCIRCGKRRPRNEYLNAMKRLDQSKDAREEFIQKQIAAEAEAKDARQQQFVRIVESRVEDEKARIMAQQEIRLEQDREDIKRATARDAVLRIIAAENAAEEKVAAAEARADAAIKGKSKEIDDIIAAEREKALNAAAEKLIAERAAIEEVAKERIDANRKASEYDAAKQIAEAKDEADKLAARQAVLQIIAAEKAAEDQIRMSRDAFQQAATERIIEERILADKEAAARYAAEKQAIERAAEERIRAEREAVKKILDERGMAGYVGGGYSAPAQQVQPFAIVPYLNPNQPVYQYNQNRVVYKFVPDAPAGDRATVEPIERVELIESCDKSKRKHKEKAPVIKAGKARVCGVVTLVLSIILVALAAIEYFVDGFTFLNIFDGCNTGSIVLACGAYFIDGLNNFGLSITAPEMLTEGFYSVAGNEIAYGIASVFMAIFAVTTLVVLIRSIVRIAGAKQNRTDWVAGLVMTIAVVAAVVAMAVIDFAKLNIIGAAVYVAVAIIITVVAAISGATKKDNKDEAEKE